MNITKKPRLDRILSLALIFTLLAATWTVPASHPAFSSTPDQSYIVQGEDVNQAAALVASVGGRVTSRLEIIQSVGALLSPEAAASLGSMPGITGVTLNSSVEIAGKEKDKEKKKTKDQENGTEKARVPATDYPDVTGADAGWERGAVGSGITVAVVDTGLEDVAEFFQSIDGHQEGRVVGWKDFVEDSRKPRDPNGHGTHIAGIIANAERGSDGEWNGIAPGVNLVGVRVLDETGAGTYEQVIQGVQWVVDHQDEYNIRVMNLSLVSPVQSPYWSDPLNQAVMRAWAAGITVVVAAGNAGPGPMTVGVPGNNPYVITVGAFTDNFTPADWNDDYIAPFSASGPTLDGFAKPDLVAPGAHMVSTVAQSSYIAQNHQANQIAPGYFSMAGTSQAAGVVSGVSALLLSQHPELTPDQVKHRLMATALPWVDPGTADALYSLWQQGAGRVNALDAVYADVQGAANAGLDIQADLAGSQHYEGYSYYDESSGLFRVRGDTGDSAEGYLAWNGDGSTSSGGYTSWSSGYGIWAGGYGIWAGGYGIWAGGYGIWAGGYGIWAGGYGIWAGGYGIWAGSEPWAGSVLSDPAFVTNFMSGESPDASTKTTYVNDWVDEP
jgi:serine protease AprX